MVGVVVEVGVVVGVVVVVVVEVVVEVGVEVDVGVVVGVVVEEYVMNQGRGDLMSWIYNYGVCACGGTIMVCGSERTDADYCWTCVNEACPNHEGTHTYDDDEPVWIKKFNLGERKDD